MGTFQERLKCLRKERDITIEKLAEDLGSAKSTISRYENGLREPKKDFLEMLSNYFDVSMDYLLGNTNVRNYNFAEYQNIESFISEVKSDYQNESIQTKTNELKDLNKYDFIEVIQDMVCKIDNKDVLKDLFLFVYMYLDRYDYLDKENDKYLIKLRNTLAHMKYNDAQLQELINLYNSNKKIYKHTIK